MNSIFCPVYPGSHGLTPANPPPSWECRASLDKLTLSWVFLGVVGWLVGWFVEWLLGWTGLGFLKPELSLWPRLVWN